MRCVKCATVHGDHGDDAAADCLEAQLATAKEEMLLLRSELLRTIPLWLARYDEARAAGRWSP
jgi:hypothetical protein